MRSADVVIVGAGVIGAAVAWWLVRASRLRVVVVDRGMPGGEASGAAAGVLAVGSVRAPRGVLFELRCRSAGLFPELAATLEEETGIDPGYRRIGLMTLAFSEAHAVALQAHVDHRRAQGLRCEMLDRSAVLSAEPAANPEVCAAAWFPDDSSVNSERLVAALVAAARCRGVQFEVQTPVQSICAGDDGRVRLQLHRDVLEAGAVVIAAGAWSADLLAPCGVKVPLRPARGEMAALRPSDWQLRHILSAGDAYLVPRTDSEVLVGSTTAFVGFDKRVSAAGLEMLLAHAAQLLPRARDATLVRTWAGLRPCSTIRRPIIARLPGLDNVILATGHHRSGIVLAPITAQLVAEMLTGAAASLPLKPFGYRKH